MYSIIIFTGQIVRDSDGLVIDPDDTNPDFLDYQSWLLEGNTPTPIYGEPVSSAKVRLCKQIDDEADKVYHGAIPTAGKLQEYLQAEIEANTFNATAVAGPFVTGWASVNGWTNEQSATDILEASAKFRTAMTGIRNVRLTQKGNVKAYEGTVATDMDVYFTTAVAQLAYIADLLKAD